MILDSHSRPTRQKHLLRQRIAHGVCALALGVGLVASPFTAAPFGVAPAAAKGGTESLADLAASVVDAVVNISASQVVEQKQAGAMPKLPPGTPFDDLFEEFFKRQLQGQNGKGDGTEAPRARRSSSLGSGFIIDSSGIVITNNHVIEGANEVTVILTDGRKLKAEVVGKDSKVDVAVLRVKSDAPLKAVKFGDSDKMRVGDAVMAVGNPFGLGGTVTAGIVSARNRNIDSGPYDNYIQTDASINKGNSGGPLFNMAGEVIGINTAILSPSGGSIGIGFATPSDTVMPVVDQLREFHETRRGWLGVRIQGVDDGIAESLGLGTARGALIAGVDEKGPGKPAGLKAGDVILTFDGKDVKESRDLPAIVASTPVGKDVPVGIFRDGKSQTVTVKLGRLEDTEKQAAANPKADQTPALPAVQTALGMSLSILSDDLRKKYSIKDTVKGVVVTDVDATSPAGTKGIKAGDVVAEINQEPVTSPADISLKVKAIKDGGKKSALLLVSNGQGEVRFVAVSLD
ncbi:DegQ family serine endoprotease [Lichenihabitans sp. PAMC28606]|uniref:DegQ family serine endoprotease n=1 Tax=Lichenihabitans sp. PAMC28606 TaxID=2880932 RepID=UPI001D0A60B5|nr:DegQ family serine endoprotease [Lichenihabitans sp. PAMC28606]UDL93435.1 DegQ family serine endoprotease [Lichenihabitans sp. PAMC28606]